MLQRTLLRAGALRAGALGAGALGAGALSVALTACQSAPTEQAATQAQSLLLDPAYETSAAAGSAEPARDYTLFEADPVRPVAVLAQSGLVAVTNTVDDYLELLRPKGSRGLERCGAVQVGLRPVAVAVVEESAEQASLWVVNHLSDSISVVRLRPSACAGEVVQTLHVGDEPRDIVVAAAEAGQRRVFVTSAHRGQHHPVPSARQATDQVTPAAQKANPGLADVFVFDPAAPGAPRVVNLFSDVPRGLAVGDGVVYAAGFRSGNRTSSIVAEVAAARGRRSLLALLARDEQGQFIERDGELLLAPGVAGVLRMEGGTAAVAGSGRCLSDPRWQGFERLQQLCVATDAQSRVERVVVQSEGVVDQSCQCTSGDGTLQPTTSVIVKFFDTPGDCGQDFTSFPDGSAGCWLDAAPRGAATPAAAASRQSPPMAWNEEVRFSLPDRDVFAIDVDQLTVARAFSGVGTTLFNLAVQPRTGKVFVTNTEAHNLTRFEGFGQSSSTSVIGHLVESRVTVIDPRADSVVPVHLNDHIDYSRCCERLPGENEKSLAFPTGIEFSPRGDQVYFTALGSDKLVIADARQLEDFHNDDAARRAGKLTEITLGQSVLEPSGPVGLALDAQRGLLYVKTLFSNEVVVVDPNARVITSRVALPSPEPESITRGRHVLYNARLTSSHGDSACFSCHAFGDLDALSWDLGDPEGETVKNPGPFATPIELAALSAIVLDPFGQDPQNRPQSPDFRSNKGPMNTQTLRGLANQGAQHWRGDRTRRFQDEPGQQPNFGSLDENNSFGEFDVAIRGLNGNDVELDPELFQDFTNFSLQLTLPPNPNRALDNTLTPEGARGRALYFGCASMSDADFESRQCTALDGSRVDVDQATQDCFCATSPVVSVLSEVPSIGGFAGLLQALLANPELSQALLGLAGDASGVPAEQQPRVAELASNLGLMFQNLLQVELAPNELGIFSSDTAGVLAGLSGNLLGVLQVSAAYGTPQGPNLLGLLASAIPPDVVPANSPLRFAAGLEQSFAGMFAVANLNLRVSSDQAARGTSAFRDLLGGCDVRQPHVCRLRVTDSFDTCHGCHTLDPRGNAEFDVYRPGFFGTSGTYTFENESQMFKVPHLRNQYQKVGMFGQAQVEETVPESTLGPNRGGFFAAQNQYSGPEVRGFGFLHDGSIDTVHRFHGATVFRQTYPGAPLGAPGTTDGLSATIPALATRADCVRSFRTAAAASLESVPEALRANVALCLESSGIPEGCFVDPLTEDCQAALGALGAARAEPDFAERFVRELRDNCFQFGSSLEGGAAGGACYPQGLVERAELEAFMLAFDSNLKPMVGQQVTLESGRFGARALAPLLFAASQGQCDAALRQRGAGFLVVRPNAITPADSRLEGAGGEVLTLGELSGGGPITATCYPPQARQAEARRAAFGRSPPR